MIDDSTLRKRALLVGVYTLAALAFFLLIGNTILAIKWPVSEQRAPLALPAVLLLACGLATALAPPPGRFEWHELRMPLGGAGLLAGCLATLRVWSFPLAQWPLPGEDYYTLLQLALQPPFSLQAFLLVGLLAAAVATPLLIVRRITVALEWQAAAGFLAGLLAVLPWMLDSGENLIFPLGIPLASCLAFTSLGAGSFLSDRGPEDDPPDRETIPVLLVQLGGGALLGSLFCLVLVTARPQLEASAAGRPRPAVEEILLECVSAQAEYFDRHREFAPSLGDLPGLDRRLGACLIDGYAIRYARFQEGRAWSISADPVLREGSWAHYHIDADGSLVRSYQPLQLYPFY